MQHLGHFLFLLGIQLDRTADLLLDVEWFAEIGDECFFRTLQLIREKAPFSRWRTLTVRLIGGSPEMSPWSSFDRFTNLESVCVWYRTHHSIITIIDRTITSRLKVLDLDTWGPLRPEHPTTSLAKSLTYISTLRAQGVRQTGNTPILPANVVNLHLIGGDLHQFPHIETYDMRECTFNRHANIDLRRMTTFIVRGDLVIRSDCCVNLPALREFSLGALWIWDRGSIEAPALDILRFTRTHAPEVSTPEVLLSNTDKSLLDRGYLLSPNTSITVEPHLWTTTVVALLAKSPKVTNAILGFTNWADAQSVLERLFKFRIATDSRSAEDEKLCPRLSELTLKLDWAFSHPSTANEWILDRLKARRDAGITPLPSIYICWKGEGTRVPLMID
jgi:hypothetical protein